jgi:hypothetical protein
VCAGAEVLVLSPVLQEICMVLLRGTRAAVQRLCKLLYGTSARAGAEVWVPRPCTANDSYGASASAGVESLFNGPGRDLYDTSANAGAEVVLFLGPAINL